MIKISTNSQYIFIPFAAYDNNHNWNEKHVQYIIFTQLYNKHWMVDWLYMYHGFSYKTPLFFCLFLQHCLHTYIHNSQCVGYKNNHTHTHTMFSTKIKKKSFLSTLLSSTYNLHFTISVANIRYNVHTYISQCTKCNTPDCIRNAKFNETCDLFFVWDLFVFLFFWVIVVPYDLYLWWCVKKNKLSKNKLNWG